MEKLIKVEPVIETIRGCCGGVLFFFSEEDCNVHAQPYGCNPLANNVL